jgi:hypothetical protein
MSKFVLNSNSVLSIGANAITCVTTVTTDESVDDIIAECFGADGYKEHVLAGTNVTGSFTFEAEADDVDILGYIAPKTAGALILQPNGATAGDIKITSTNLQITQRSFTVSRGGLATGTASFVCDDLTIAANSA